MRINLSGESVFLNGCCGSEFLNLHVVVRGCATMPLTTTDPRMIRTPSRGLCAILVRLLAELSVTVDRGRFFCDVLFLGRQVIARLQLLACLRVRLSRAGSGGGCLQFRWHDQVVALG